MVAKIRLPLPEGRQMPTNTFPWLALGLGGLLALFLLLTLPSQANGETAVPLLAQLFAAELGFFITGAGAIVAVRARLKGDRSVQGLMSALGCVLLALAFLLLGVALWPPGGLGEP